MPNAKNWISIHIFYFSNVNALLVECVTPLLAELRQNNLIKQAFFIRYWMEGHHVRLRLLVADNADEAEIKSRAEARISKFLDRRPALYEPDLSRLSPFYKILFVAEYGEEKWAERYGENGQMPTRRNNTFDYIKYEPEYRRYGGVEGVELAEWHFEHSSDTVLKLIGETNQNIRSILLGMSIQLSLPLCYEFLGTEEHCIRFLEGYIAYWQYTHETRVDFDVFDHRYEQMAPDLQRRADEIARSVQLQDTDILTPTEQNWLTHIKELNLRLTRLVEQGKITYPTKFRGKGMYLAGDANKMNDHEFFVVEDVTTARQILLTSYIHMTNNRLGTTIHDEIYLAYLLRRTLQERLEVKQEVAS